MEVECYGVGIVSASVCAPADMPLGAVTAELNRQHPTGMDYPWHPAEEPHFATGQPNPCPCDRHPDRTHYLFHC